MSAPLDDSGLQFSNGLQFIDGQHRRGGSAEPLTVTHPSTGEVLVTETMAGTGDVDDAVAAAAAAFPGWSGATPAEHSTLLHRLAAELDGVAAQLAAVESRQAGKPIRLTENFDVPGTVDNVAFFAGAARNLDGKASAEYSGEHTSSIRREPIGSIAPCWWCCPSTTPMVSHWPTTPPTGLPRQPGPRASSGPSAPPPGSPPAACGSTTTSRSSARCRTAGTGPPASARTCPPTPSRSTRRSSTGLRPPSTPQEQGTTPEPRG